MPDHQSQQDSSSGDQECLSGNFIAVNPTVSSTFTQNYECQPRPKVRKKLLGTMNAFVIFQDDVSIHHLTKMLDQPTDRG